MFVKERRSEESFQAFTERLGKRALGEMLADLTSVPSHEQDPAYYSDWGIREFIPWRHGRGRMCG